MSERDFTRKRERITFRIDDDEFEAAPALPGRTLTEFAHRFSDVSKSTGAGQLDVLSEALELVLLPESSARFMKRFSDLANPIELEQASDVVIWLLEQYGLRPTEPSSSSVTGSDSPESGMSSMDGQPSTEQTSQTFPQTVS